MSLEKPLRLDGEALVLCRGFDGVAGWVLDNKDRVPCRNMVGWLGYILIYLELHV